MTLAHKKTYGSMEQHRKYRNKPMSVNLTKSQEYTVSSISDVGKTGQLHVKE